MLETKTVPAPFPRDKASCFDTVNTFLQYQSQTLEQWANRIADEFLMQHMDTWFHRDLASLLEGLKLTVNNIYDESKGLSKEELIHTGLSALVDRRAYRYAHTTLQQQKGLDSSVHISYSEAMQICRMVVHDEICTALPQAYSLPDALHAQDAEMIRGINSFIGMNSLSSS
jgi:hypothetical protein